jgi:hypothetical protein
MVEIAVLGLGGCDNEDARRQRSSIADSTPSASATTGASLPCDTLGRWLDNRENWRNRIALLQCGQDLALHRVFFDGAVVRTAVRERRTAEGRRLQEDEVPVTGDYYLITKSGSLEIRDNDGLIATAVPIR